MGILSDRQIQAEVKIEPFVVYDKKKQEGKISFGRTSYGYDARIGYKFKVFKPYPCESIDPKNFNPKMLEEVDLTPYHTWVTKSTLGYTQCEHCNLVEMSRPTPDPGCPKSSKPNHILIPPHSFVLGETFETFTVPRDVLCVVVGKSTYARCGIVINVTPGEPEWIGKWTVEISNTTPLPAKVYCGEGIMQCLFFRSDERDYSAVKAIKTIADTMSRYEQGTALSTHSAVLYDLIRIATDPTKTSCEVSYADKKGKYANQKGLTLPFVTSPDDDKKEG